MAVNISPRVVGLALAAFLAYLFIYEFPSVLGFPFNFVFVGILIVILIALAISLFHQ